MNLALCTQVCGDAEVWGDGIVPLLTAHLEGAINVDLDGVYHSPLGASKVRRTSRLRYVRPQCKLDICRGQRDLICHLYQRPARPAAASSPKLYRAGTASRSCATTTFFLQDRQWYGSEDILDQWIHYLHRDV